MESEPKRHSMHHLTHNTFIFPKSWDLWMEWEMNTGAVLLKLLDLLNRSNLVVAAQTPGYYTKTFSSFVFPCSSQVAVGPQNPKEVPPSGGSKLDFSGRGKSP